MKREGNGMNAINTNERKADNSIRKSKFWSTLKKVLLYTVAAVAVVLILAVLYQILEFLFVGAILFLAWICPKRWW
jgi:cell division protein FtsL